MARIHIFWRKPASFIHVQGIACCFHFAPHIECSRGGERRNGLPLALLAHFGAKFPLPFSSPVKSRPHLRSTSNRAAAALGIQSKLAWQAMAPLRNGSAMRVFSQSWSTNGEAKRRRLKRVASAGEKTLTSNEKDPCLPIAKPPERLGEWPPSLGAKPYLLQAQLLLPVS